MSSFSERHQPRFLSDFVFEDDDTRVTVTQYAAKQRDDPLILVGPYGSGKSALAKVIVETRAPQHLAMWHPYNVVFHARDIESANFEERAIAAWNIQHVGDHGAYCIIDEVDQLSISDQHKLRALMDSRGNIGSFIMTTNFLHKIDKAIVDRSTTIEIPAFRPELWAVRAQAILRTEGIDCQIEKIIALLAHSNGSMRDALRALEQTCLSNRAAKADKSQPQSV